MSQHTVPCAHCGQPAPALKLNVKDPEQPQPEGQQQQQLSFCCTGCESVYHMLHGAGLDSFYRFSQQDVVGGEQACSLEGSPVPQDRLERLEAGLVSLWQQRAERDEQGVSTLHFYLRGLHCAGCIWLIEQLPQQLDGVIEARVELGRQRLMLRWRQDQLDLGVILDWLARFGYSAHALDHAQEDQLSKGRHKPLLRRMGVAWAIAGNVMLLSFAHYSGLNALDDPLFYHGARVLSLAMTTVGLFYGADLFIRRAAASVRVAVKMARQRIMPRLSMDVPLSVGIILGWLYSAWATLSGAGEVWFDSIAMLVAALLTSRWLQASANTRAAEATRQIYALLPQTARRLDEHGEAQLIESQTLAVGDRVEVRPGELVPADGVIIEGTSALHRGALTGESRAEAVAQGCFVEAGVTNMDNPIIVQVSAIGGQTRLGQLQSWIEDHATRRAPIEQLTDRLGALFIMGILVVAALTALLWSAYQPQLWLSHTIAVLVVSCPCALAMASPLTLSVALGRAAKQGIFIKHDDVVEALAKADVVVFDKTGTLTHGDLSLVASHGPQWALEAAAALEQQSNHPVARAIAKIAPPSKSLKIEGEIEHVAGQGVIGVVGGRNICVGAPTWVLAQMESTLSVGLSQILEQYTQQGLTPVLIGADFAPVALLGLGDKLRDEAQLVLDELRAQGIRPLLLSGDHQDVVQVVGQQLGFADDELRGQVTHEQKLETIQSLKSKGHTVVMIGDGVNDAAALQAADVGITFERGAQVSLLASDVFLRTADLRAILSLSKGAKQSMRVIRANLWSSAIYNIIATGLAMMGLISPLIAAIIMPISSLSVVLSSIFQQHFMSSARDVHAPSTPQAQLKETYS